MNKKKHLINKIKIFDNKYFNEDQKKIAISILESAPEEEVQAYADFIFMKRRTGFAFDYSPEIAKGRLITLKEDIDRRINVGDKLEEDENKLIIGDNYNALKSLLVTHKEKIDVIYIDPPYNTESAKTDGNQSSKEGESSKFIYKDKFGRGGWLNMMKARLTLAKDLLSSNGVIFVSIDDSEQAYLKVLMDEIFGEDNFITNINWYNKKEGRSLGNDLFSSTYEYILCYSKDKATAKTNYVRSNDVKELSKYNSEDKYGWYKKGKPLFNDNPKKFNEITRKNLSYRIFVSKVGEINLEEKKDFIEIFPPDYGVVRGCWTWSKEKLIKEKDFLKVYKYKNTFMIYKKSYLNGDGEKLESPKNSISFNYRDDENTLNIRNTGNIELKKILNDNNFDTPKPVPVIKWLLERATSEKSIILDFFAGSGTTGQAVMDLNRNDNGNRKFILCTNNENKIAQNVTYERLHRIIKGETPKGKKDFDWIKNNKPYKNEKLRVININDDIKISLDEDVNPDIYKNAKDGLKLLDAKYNKVDLNLYYDLAALNPLENEDDKYDKEI